MFIGVALSFDAFNSDYSVSPLLSKLPDLHHLWLAGALGIGGAFVLVALLHHWNRVDTSWRLERSGWWLVFGGWLAIALLMATASPHSVLAWGSSAAFAIAGFLRGQAVQLTEKRARELKERSGE